MINAERLLESFLEMVRISSPAGAEAQVASIIEARLRGLGLEVERDAAGNLLAKTDGHGTPVLLTAHMDTVVPCDKVIPIVREGVVYSDGSTILGADDKAGVAIILEVLQVLAEDHVAHRPLDVLFTVREEVGLEGAKAFDVRRLRAKIGVGLDMEGEQGTIVVRGPSQNALWAQVHGRAAHAGSNPEDGINAIRVAAEAIVAMPLGRIDAETTANIGVISGGLATNIIPDLVTLRGEARSRDEAKLEAQTRAMTEALEHSAQAAGATADIKVTRTYSAYHFDEHTSVVRWVSAAMRAIGIEPLLVPTGGGSDANVLNAAGMETVQISAGMEEVHTLKEHVAVAEMVTAAHIVLACTA
jgi:tripeptide aminopeptidase